MAFTSWPETHSVFDEIWNYEFQLFLWLSMSAGPLLCITLWKLLLITELASHSWRLTCRTLHTCIIFGKLQSGNLLVLSLFSATRYPDPSSPLPSSSSIADFEEKKSNCHPKPIKKRTIRKKMTADGTTRRIDRIFYRIYANMDKPPMVQCEILHCCDLFKISMWVLDYFSTYFTKKGFWWRRRTINQFLQKYFRSHYFWH